MGDFGPWKQSKGSYRKAPTCIATAKIESDNAVFARALQIFGSKYSDGWSKWGPRFQKGLASGERVLIRYTPTKNGRS